MTGAIILGLIAAGCWAVSVWQYSGRGFLINNAYLFASAQERETMDKKPYYRQSGTVFLLIGVVFALNAAQMLFHQRWLFYIVLAVIAVILVYAIVSTVKIDKRDEPK